MPARPRYTTEQIAQALVASGGLLSQAATLLAHTYGRPISRAALSMIVTKTPALQQLRRDCEEGLLDLAEGVIKTHLGQDNLKAATFVLRTRGASRGYVEISQQNHTALDPETFRARLRAMARQIAAQDDGLVPGVQDGRDDAGPEGAAA